jgi:pilus assembly protein Flp/PilA
MRSIRSNERGATAIEYAIIAALIGIGLIASLVSTRGSLSSIFGVASSNMASANAGVAAGNGVTSQRAVAAAATSPRAPYWNAKTLASKTVTQPDATSQLTTFTYTDGSSGSYLAQFDANGALTGEVVTAYPIGYAGRTMDSLQFTYAADGTQLSMVYTDRYASGVARQISSSAAASGWAETVKYYNTSGAFTSQISNGTTEAGVRGTGTGDEIYFRALANQ